MERNGAGRGSGHKEPVVVLVPQGLAGQSYEVVAREIATTATLLVVDGEHRRKALQAALGDVEVGR